QRGVVDGYRLAFDSRRTARNRGRVEAACRALIELYRQAGDEDAAAKTERELAELPASGN
ncbi:MAG: hypothetical protein KDC48_11855, partial [Planctomycetes bacterium]|nr:hypothetical protein [Planctomycetota bacterium]